MLFNDFLFCKYMNNKQVKYNNFLNTWIEYHKQFIKEATCANYRNIVDNHLARDFTEVELVSFSNLVLQKYVLDKWQHILHYSTFLPFYWELNVNKMCTFQLFRLLHFTQIYPMPRLNQIVIKSIFITVFI